MMDALGNYTGRAMFCRRDTMDQCLSTPCVDCRMRPCVHAPMRLGGYRIALASHHDGACAVDRVRAWLWCVYTR